MQRLIYIMDPMCSWCWGFAPVVEALSAQARDFAVPLHIVVGGLRLDRAPLEASVRAKVLAHWQNVAKSTGQPFQFDNALPEGFIYDTSLACEAVVAARTLAPERVLVFTRALQEAFYCEQKSLRDISVLTELAALSGLDRKGFAQCLDQDANEQATLKDFTWARDLGIVGFPTLLAERDGHLALLTNGYQSYEALSPLLGRWLDQARRE